MSKFCYKKEVELKDIFWGLLKLCWWMLAWVFFLTMVNIVLVKGLDLLCNDWFVCLVLQLWALAPPIYVLYRYWKNLEGVEK